MRWLVSLFSRRTTRNSAATASGYARDAERENVLLDWDLGQPDEDEATPSQQ